MEYWTIGLIILIVGIFLLIVEVLTPGQTFMAIPGTVAVVLGIMAMMLGQWLFSAVWYAPVIALLIAAPTTIITVWGYKKLSSINPPTTTVGDSLVGRQGMVTVMVVPDSTKGKVKIGSQSWSATSEEEIPIGEKVEVVASEGVHVHVVRVSNITKFEKDMRGKED
jgi:membrane protein implicated in regulation of membrane protease activity